jgi:hypothetical protein
MSRRGYILISFGSLLLIAAVVALVLALSARQKRHNWYPHYVSRGMQKKQPYGTYYLRQLMESRQGAGTFRRIKKPLPHFFSNAENKKGVYVFIGHYPMYSHEAASSLLSFASAGNTVFLGVNMLPDNLIQRLVRDTATVEDVFLRQRMESVTTTLRSGDAIREWKFWFQDAHTKSEYNWSVLNKDYFNPRKLPGSVIGRINDSDLTCYRITAGEGQIIIHANPIFFSNYLLVTEDGFSYASALFSFIPAGGDIYFDDYSNSPSSDMSRRRNKSDAVMGDSLLGFILTSPGLQWAWYLAMAMGLLLLIFRSGRLQRPIPVIKPNINTTLEYVKTTGQIFYRTRNHRQLALLQKQLFMQHLASRYRIRLKAPREVLVRELKIRAGVPEELAVKLFSMMDTIGKAEKIKSEELVQWYGLLQQFYQINHKNYGNIRKFTGTRL